MVVSSCLFSIPAALLLVAFLPNALLAEIALLPVLVPLAAAYGTYYQVRIYYAKKAGALGSDPESPRVKGSHLTTQPPERSLRNR